MPDPDIIAAYDEWERKNRAPSTSPGGILPGVAVATSPPAVATPSSQADPDIIEAYDKLTTGQPIVRPDKPLRRSQQAVARAGYAPPETGIPEFMPGVTPKPRLTPEQHGLPPIGDVSRDPFLGPPVRAMDWWQRNVSDPIGAVANAPVMPGPRIPGFSRGSSGFGLQTEQLPWEPGWRERYYENVPLGTRIATNILLDPLNLFPGVGFTKMSQVRRLGGTVGRLGRLGRGGESFELLLRDETGKVWQLSMPGTQEAQKAVAAWETEGVARRLSKGYSPSERKESISTLGRGAETPPALTAAEPELAPSAPTGAMRAIEEEIPAEEAAAILAEVYEETAQGNPLRRLIPILGPKQTQFAETLTPKQALAIYQHGAPFSGTNAEALAEIRRIYPHAITKGDRVMPEYALDDVMSEYGPKYTEGNGVELLLRDIEAAKAEQGDAITQRVVARRAAEPIAPAVPQAEVVPPIQTGALQAGMGIGEPPPQGVLPLGGQEGISRPLIDAEQVAERAAGQRALPEGIPSLSPSLEGRPAGVTPAASAGVPPPTGALGVPPPAPPGGVRIPPVSGGVPTQPPPPPGPPPRGGTAAPPGAVSPPPRPPAVDLILGIPGEDPGGAALRKYAGSRNKAGLEARRWVEEGDQLLKTKGTTARVAGRPVVSPELGNHLLMALHGEGPAPAGFEDILRDLQFKMSQETGDMLAADPSFSKRMLPGPDYFPRMWKMPKKTPTGSPQLGRKPFFFKQRSDLSYAELREAGFEPVSNNPYDMLALRRVAGTDYRDGLVMVARLKKMGKALPLDEVSLSEKANWRVPEVGPAFEGRPFPTKEGAAAMTQPVAVPNNVASVLEGMFGKRPSLEIAGKNIVPMVGTVSQMAKRAKLMASLFQHLDFGMRVGAEALSPSAILNGTTMNFPQFLARGARGQFSEASRAATRQRLLSDAPILRGTDLSMRMLVEEGLEVGGDTTVLRRTIRSFLDDVGKDVPRSRAGRAFDRLGGVNRFFEKGLFENIYPLAQEWAVRNHIVPVLKATHPGWTSRQIAGQAAKDANIMFSNLGAWQTVFAQPAMKELTRTLIFSTNESESWIRSGLATVRGPSKRVWLEHWAGLGLLLAGLANIIHMSTTGEPLPADRYKPVAKSPYGPLPVNYNRKFLSPDIPLKDKNGENINLDLVGQADTVFQFALDPVSALAARENVVPRAIITQVKGETFGRQQLKTPQQRAVALATELAAPIGAGEVLQAERERTGPLKELLPRSEVKLGEPGHLLQAAGVNVRSPRTDLELHRQYEDGIASSLEGRDREVWQKYKKVQGTLRDDWLELQPYGVQSTVKALRKRETDYRKKLRLANPMLDVLLVERGYTPVTPEGKRRLAEIQKEKLGGVSLPADNRFAPTYWPAPTK